MKRREVLAEDEPRQVEKLEDLDLDDAESVTGGTGKVGDGG